MILIEFDGQQHFQHSKYFHRGNGKYSFAGSRLTDIEKTKSALDAGYRIIRIHYKWRELKKAEQIEFLRLALASTEKFIVNELAPYQWLSEFKPVVVSTQASIRRFLNTTPNTEPNPQPTPQPIPQPTPPTKANRQTNPQPTATNADISTKIANVSTDGYTSSEQHQYLFTPNGASEPTPPSLPTNTDSKHTKVPPLSVVNPNIANTARPAKATPNSTLTGAIKRKSPTPVLTQSILPFAPPPDPNTPLTKRPRIVKK